ncbi:hypothetical protein OMCYN_01776 [cyanobiont of Ornithocercus magnificus]|nr:hypothetical protein OMCYN_01776 [cyanobiont of Ornithocercus magnificus]
MTPLVSLAKNKQICRSEKLEQVSNYVTNLLGGWN